MKRFLVICVLAATAAGPCLAQRTGIREEVRMDRTLPLGPDKVYDFDVPDLTPAPEGYEPVYLSHYGRHGSRYAYSSRTYGYLQEALAEGAATGNLTPYGAKLKEDLEPFFEAVTNHVGELTRKGWDQLYGIGRRMVEFFPTVFPDGAWVDAGVSPSIRSVMSMNACCLAIGQSRPEVRIFEHQTWDDLRSARPNMGYKDAYAFIGAPCPTQESSASFIERTVDWKAILGRIFKDPAAALGKYKPADALDYLYMMVAGMESLDDGIVPDVSGIFTREEFATMWEADNYLRYREYYEYLAPCCSIYEDIIERADEHLSDGSRGADLRFGHDHVLLTLLMIADIEAFGHFASRPEDVAFTFQNFRSPMGGNLQFVFYGKEESSPAAGLPDVLVQVILNGEETWFSGLEPAVGPFYDWTELKAFLSGRMDLFRKP